MFFGDATKVNCIVKSRYSNIDVQMVDIKWSNVVDVVN